LSTVRRGDDGRSEQRAPVDDDLGDASRGNAAPDDPGVAIRQVDAFDQAVAFQKQ